MRKFLRNFFWSHGAQLGYLGSLSQKGHPEIFSKWVLINLSNPLRHPAPLVDPLLTKKLDTAGPWCAFSCPPQNDGCPSGKSDDIFAPKKAKCGIEINVIDVTCLYQLGLAGFNPKNRSNVYR